MGRYDDALRVARQLTRAQARKPDGYLLQARVYLAERAFGVAAERAQEALKVAPRDAAAQQMLRRVETGRFEAKNYAAHESSDRAIGAFSRGQRARRSTGVVLPAAGKVRPVGAALGFVLLAGVAGSLLAVRRGFIWSR